MMQNVSTYCPGCAPGDFPQPHICGIVSWAPLTTGFCYLCNQPWTGSHLCVRAWQAADTTVPVAPTREPSVLDLMGRATDMILAGRLTRKAFRELFFSETPEEAGATLEQIDSKAPHG